MGYIKPRKYVNIAADHSGDHVFLVDNTGERHFTVAGTVGFPFFSQMIRDSLNGTETAMAQAHIFKAWSSALRHSSRLSG